MSLRSIWPYLRASLLALLVVGVVIKPMLGSLCEIHAISDAVAGYVADLGHDSDPEHQTDRDHASGAHDPLHEDNNSGGFAHIVGVIVVPERLNAAARQFVPAIAGIPQQYLSETFRPPIA